MLPIVKCTRTNQKIEFLNTIDEESVEIGNLPGFAPLDIIVYSRKMYIGEDESSIQ